VCIEREASTTRRYRNRSAATFFSRQTDRHADLVVI
jgi:hypothetical protein